MTRVLDPVMKELRETLLLMGSRAEAILAKSIRSISERDAQLALQGRFVKDEPVDHSRNPDEYLYEELGLTRLWVRTRSFPWAKA